MQTDNEDGPQTLPHRRRGRQTSHGRARGRRPRWGTLSSLGLRRPGTSGSPTDCPPPPPVWSGRMPPRPAHPGCPDGQPPASVSGASSHHHPPHRTVLRGFRTTTRPQRCRPTPGQTHGAAARAAGSSDTDPTRRDGAGLGAGARLLRGLQASERGRPSRASSGGGGQVAGGGSLPSLPAAGLFFLEKAVLT